MADPCGYNYNGKFFKDKKSFMDYLNGEGKSKMLSDIKEVSTLKEESRDLKNQISDLFKASVEAVKITEDRAKDALNRKSFIVKGIRDALSKKAGADQKKGSILSSKAGILIDKLNKLDVYDSSEVESFVNYSENLFSKADYDLKLSNAKKAKRAIAKANVSGSKKKAIKAFLKINPENVSDLEEYNSYAEKIKNSVSSSRLTSIGIKLRTPMEVSEINDYVDSEVNKQKEINSSKIKESFDSIAKNEGLSEEDMSEINDINEDDTTFDENIDTRRREAIKSVFNTLSVDVKNLLNKDSNLDKEDRISDSSRRVIKDVMNVDLDLLPTKEGLKLAEALNDFLVNKETTGLDSILSYYKGDKGVLDAAKEGALKGKEVKTLFTSFVGQVAAEQFTNIKLLSERIFGGGSKGILANKTIGITEFENGAARSVKKSDDFADSYNKKFSKLKPNGLDFKDRKNVIERGMFASIFRDIDSAKSDPSEFKRKKEWVEHSIKVLSEGDLTQRQNSKDIQFVYDKILKDSNNAEEVASNVDEVNLDAVNSWVEGFADIFEELSDVSLNVHGNELGRDVNYTPDVIKKVTEREGKMTGEWYEQSFINNSGLPKKKAGVLEVNTRQKPTGDMYMDYNFETNMLKTYKSALMDINTSRAVRQIDGALKSKGFKQLIKNKDIRDLYEARIKAYISREKGFYQYDSSKLNKAVGHLETILNTAGHARALFSLSGPIKQAVPMINTFVNTGQFPIRKAFNKSYLDFVKNSGRSVATRGSDAVTMLDKSNDITNVKGRTMGSRFFENILKKDRWLLKQSIGRSDVATALSSWGAYYEKSLKRQGKPYKDIDYSKHELNEEAADYADTQVSKNQGASATSQEGEFYKNQNAVVRLVRGGLFPFAKFGYNQKMKMGTDWSVMNDKNASKQDRADATRSLAATIVEEVSFKAIAAGISYGLGAAAINLFGGDDSEEEKKKAIDKVISQTASGIATDFFSPLPMLDGTTLETFEKGIDQLQDALDISEEDRFKMYVPKEKKLSDALGTMGIQLSLLKESDDLFKAARDGIYVNRYGKETPLSDENRRIIGKYIFPISLFHSLGLLPSEARTFLNKALSQIEKNNELSEEEFENYFREAEEEMEEDNK